MSTSNSLTLSDTTSSTLSSPSPKNHGLWQERFQTLLQDYPHLDHSEKECTDIVLKDGGGFGDVYEAHLWIAGRKIKVALKQMRSYMLKDESFVRFIVSEMAIWSQLRHRNVVEFMGYRMDDSNGPTLISRWMENGTAFQYVTAHPQTDIYPLVLGIAQGLDYLHYSGVVHSDIKSDNVFISATGVPQISDFGMSRMIGASQRIRQTTTGSIRGSIPWMAMELFESGESKVTYTRETDIWAFGMTVYELITRKRPYEDLNNVMALISTIGHGVKPQSPERRELSSLDSRLLWQVCNVSWSDKPEDRWAMGRVVTFLSRRSASESDVESLGTNMSSMDLHGHPSPYAARAKSSDHVSSSQPSLKRPEKASSRKEKTSSTIISSKFRKSFQKFREFINPSTSDIHTDSHFDAHSEGHSEIVIPVEEVVKAKQETVSQSAELARQNADPAFRANLAQSYGSLSTILITAGRVDEALKAREAVVSIDLDMVRDDPSATNRSSLASAYHNLGIDLNTAGRLVEAASAANSAIEYRARLAKEDPDPMHRIFLAQSYGSLATILSSSGKLDEALKARHSVIKINEQLVNEDPSISNRSALASAYHNLGIDLNTASKFKEALDTVKVAIEMRSELVKVEPNPNSRAYLAQSYDNQSNILSSLGRYEEALVAARAGVEANEEIVKEDSSPGFRENLGRSYYYLATNLKRLDRTDEALDARQKAVDINAELAKENPTSALRNALASSYYNHSIDLNSASRHEEALKAAQESVNIREDLKHTDPSVRNYLAQSYDSLGAAAQALGRIEEAVHAMQQSVAIKGELLNEGR